MSTMSIILIAIVVAIMVKTGSIGKGVGFLMKYLFYPVLFAIIGGVVGSLLGIGRIMVAVGAIAGLVFAFRDAKKKIK